MAVTKIILRSILISITLFAQQLFANTASKVKAVFNFYTQSGGQGEQIYGTDQKEEVQVMEPMLFIDHKINETTTINAHFVLDSWTAASDTQLDGNTGASTEDDGAPEEAITRQGRGSAQIGITNDYKTWLWSSRLGISSEFDYKSLNFGGTIQKNFANDNFVVALSPQLFLDKAKTYDLVAQDVTEFQGRTIYSLDLSASQILTPSDIIQFGATYINMNGMLNNISNTVKVLSNPYSNSLSRVEENLPDSRERYALSVKAIHAFTDETALHASYRYYDDSWGTSADTAEISLAQSYFEDDAFLKVSYRYYNQTENQYYAHQFATVEQYMTSDSDMEAFTGNRFGVHYGHSLGEKKAFGFTLDDIQIDGGVYYYKRSNDLTYTLAQAGVHIQF